MGPVQPSPFVSLDASVEHRGFWRPRLRRQPIPHLGRALGAFTQRSETFDLFGLSKRTQGPMVTQYHPRNHPRSTQCLVCHRHRHSTRTESVLTSAASAGPKRDTGLSGTIELVAGSSELAVAASTSTTPNYGETVWFATTVNGNTKANSLLYVSVVCTQDGTVVYQSSGTPTLASRSLTKALDGTAPTRIALRR